MSEAFDPSGLRLLVTKLVDGVGTDGDRRRLNELLAESQEARRYYARLMVLQALLIQDGGRPPTANAETRAVPTVEADLPAAAQSAAPVAANISTAQPTKTPVLGFLGGVVDYVNHSRRLMFLLVAVLLSGWFVFQVGSVLLGRWLAADPQVADRGGEGPDARQAPLTPEQGLAQSHGKALAWLSGSVGGRWQIAVPKPAGAEFWEIGTEFTAGQKVNLVAGLGEITFHSGAKVVVSAPAQFVVTSALGAELQEGKLSARVPHDASGFTVITPAGSVVDLGTEFGVEVTPDHKLDVQVFVGEVKINASQGSAEGGIPGFEVTAGHTAHVEPGHPATVVKSTDKNRFQRNLQIDIDSRDKALATYLEFMRQLKPVVWYRMEGRAADRTIHNEVAGGPDGKLFWDGPGNPFVDGRVGRGLWLRGEGLKDCAIVPDYPKSTNGKLSVVAWAYAESRPKLATIVSNWGNQNMGQFVFQLAGEVGGHAQDYCAEVLQTDGSGAIAHEGIDHPFPLHEWVHVAFTVDGKTLRLYRQGREVAMAKVTGFQTKALVRPLGIGGRPSDSGEPDRFYWDGELDEVAVFNDTLSADDIQKLANAPPR